MYIDFFKYDSVELNIFCEWRCPFKLKSLKYKAEVWKMCGMIAF